MEKTFSLMIENPFSTSVVFGSLSLFVWVVSKCIPNPLDKIKAILEVLLHEADPKSKKDWVERINWFSILLFAIFFIMQLLLFGSSSILGSILSNYTPKNLPSISLITLIFLFLIVIYSPLLIIFTKGDKFIKDKGNVILNK